MLTIAGVWLISLSVPFVYFEVGYITYAFIFANTAVAVAIAITCATYTLMLRKVRERSQNISNQNVRETPYTISTRETTTQVQSIKTASPKNTTNSIITSAREMEEKVTKMFIVVLIAMLCCYGPSTLFIYIMSFCESCSCTTLHWFRDLQFIFVLMNSSVNFWCYALQSPRFRNAFTKILKIKNRRNGTEEPRFSSVQNMPTVSFSNSADLEQGEIKIDMKNDGATNKGLDNANN
jgi:hypothetical protein